jgi:xanthine/CO dehydrogenase XdhC/CoxF family maturation factor
LCCHGNVRLLTSVANTQTLAPRSEAQQTHVYVFRVGTKSGNASAPTLVFMSVRQTFPDRLSACQTGDGIVRIT